MFNRNEKFFKHLSWKAKKNKNSNDSLSRFKDHCKKWIERDSSMRKRLKLKIYNFWNLSSCRFSSKIAFKKIKWSLILLTMQLQVGKSKFVISTKE